ncbi:disulfide isomerase DsbC N-terminal domain-containing protein [Marinobacter salicampi]|uniref:disulfide isomerase DsbC N-terminal domain-containing protein n=1 Tax=Marinobacter salicampi TaxID=435907 RepID=UPI00140B0EA7|nr:disulfide isomerase DsbC N-terminal domain-containing protein [Marinobacter salicampi]
MVSFKSLRFLALVAALAVLSSLASANSFEKLKEMGLNPKSVTEMPIDGMIAYEAQNGQVMFMTKDGRYVFSGTASDVWNKKVLETGADVMNSARTIPLAQMEIDFDQLGALTIGAGSKIVHVVTDPKCSACKKLNDQMQDLSSEYTFKVLVLPALGEMSREASKKIACTQDREAAAKAFLANQVDDLDLPQNCNMDAYKQALLVADYIRVREVPFLIGPNDFVNRGLPQDLETWLASSSSFITSPDPANATEPSETPDAESIKEPSSGQTLNSINSLNNRLRESLK